MLRYRITVINIWPSLFILLFKQTNLFYKALLSFLLDHQFYYQHRPIQSVTSLLHFNPGPQVLAAELLKHSIPMSSMYIHLMLVTLSESGFLDPNPNQGMLVRSENIPYPTMPVFSRAPCKHIHTNQFIIAKPHVVIFLDKKGTKKKICT